MKQIAINVDINARIKDGLIGSCCILKNFQLNYLLPLYDEHNLPTILYLPDSCFETAIKYLSNVYTNSNIVLIPPNSRFLHEPDNLQFSYDSHMGRAKELLARGSGSVTFIICAWSGRNLPVVGDGASANLHLKINSVFENCVNFLISNNYNNVDVVCSPGEYCLRGGIIDVFPSSRKQPIRINFLGEKTAFHLFDPNTQITTSSLSQYFIPSSRCDNLFSIKESLSGCFYNLYFNIKKHQSSNDMIINFSNFYSSITHKKFYKINKDKLSIGVDDRLSTAGVLLPLDRALVPSWFLNKTPASPVAPREIEPTSLDLINIKKGDYLVHRNYGVGKFMGLFLTASNDGNEQEFVSIKYNNDELIRVDVSRLELVSFFATNDSENVVLDSLQKRNVWTRKRVAAKRAAEEAAASLLSLYVKRDGLERKPAQHHVVLENKFINDFPFIETEDQKTAWKEISTDMSLPTPMDRLLCGDVGFGKTELAMRATFRCVMGGKRVVVLAPTTLLATQHNSSFNNRMASHGVLINVVSRIQSKKNVTLTRTNITNNNNDVLIGTHGLLNDPLYLKNIGLLIIDEEHRFGVLQKEKIKKHKDSIDVLSMSATPIPRSLNLALSGVCSISLLQTPPLMRFPITTHIKLFNDNIIRDAVLFEVDRGGQVYFVHNNIQSIQSCTNQLTALLPNQNIQNIHGKESAQNIENTMERFLSGKIDVLVTTSIIEVGIDVPNANCIIINNAHLFGLSQLYQMRGRVGRSHRQAHAYLLLPARHKIQPRANKRLQSIAKNIKLGSGYNISRSDMEIRGAGSLFGFKQSGGGGSVGYEMYLKLIQRTFHGSGKLNSNFKILPEDVVIELFAERLIPNNYISIDDLRLSFYKNIVKAMTLGELDSIVHNVSNRFGAPPLPFNNLIKEAKIRLLAATAGITLIKPLGCGLICSIGEGFSSAYFAAIYDFFKLFFLKREIDYHLLPSKNKSLSLCMHIPNSIDKYSLLSKFLNKFNVLK